MVRLVEEDLRKNKLSDVLKRSTTSFSNKNSQVLDNRFPGKPSPRGRVGSLGKIVSPRSFIPSPGVVSPKGGETPSTMNVKRFLPPFLTNYTVVSTQYHCRSQQRKAW